MPENAERPCATSVSDGGSEKCRQELQLSFKRGAVPLPRTTVMNKKGFSVKVFIIGFYG